METTRTIEAGSSRKGNGHSDRRVLIAEDERRQSDQLVALLRELGHEPSVARSGPEAIRIAAETQPDLIILDGLLPGMNGCEVARFIRQSNAAYHPHIALATAVYKHVRYRNEATLKFGVDSYVIKPLSSTSVRDILHAAGIIEIAKVA